MLRKYNLGDEEVALSRDGEGEFTYNESIIYSRWITMEN